MDDILATIFKNQSPKNPLVVASLYSFQLISPKDLHIWRLSYALMNDLDRSIKSPLHLTLVALYCMYNSTNIIYNLPSLLNRPVVNRKPSLHIMFGEDVAQLVSISLMAEAFSNLSLLQKSLKTNNYISKIMDIIYQEYNSLHQDSQILLNLEHINRDNIQYDYNQLSNKLFIRSLESVFILLGYNDEKLCSIRNDLEQMREFMVNRSPIPDEILLQFCDKINISFNKSNFGREILQMTCSEKKST